MNRRVLVAAIATLLVLPSTLHAQLPPRDVDLDWDARFRVTPFIGYLTSFDRTEDWSYTDGGEVRVLRTRHTVGGGGGVGVSVEVPVRGRIGATAAAAYFGRDRTVLTTAGGEAFQLDGNEVLYGRLGAVLHLAQDPSELVLRRLGASLYAGAVVMREEPRNRLGTAEFMTSGTHFGLNLGATGEIPFAADRFAVQVGLEDNIMWWSDKQLTSVAREYLRTQGNAAEPTVSADMTHSWLLRAGLSVRVR